MTDELLCVAPSMVAKFWPIVEPMLRRAYDEVDELMPSDLPDALSEGKLLLWISAPDGKILAALVTALLPRPSGLACKLMVCGGTDMAIWLGNHTQIEAYAKAEGCTKLFAEGRLAWNRVLPGYEAKRIVLEKRL